MRIGVDLDNTFCTDRYESGGISKCEPKEGAIEKLTEMRKAGHTVIFYTHRDEGHRKETILWLQFCGVKYDGIIFGKPHFDRYIGDEVFEFVSWDLVRLEDL